MEDKLTKIEILSSKLEITYNLSNSSITFIAGNSDSLGFRIKTEGDEEVNNSAVFNDVEEFEEIFSHFKEQIKKVI